MGPGCIEEREISSTAELENGSQGRLHRGGRQLVCTPISQHGCPRPQRLPTCTECVPTSCHAHALPLSLVPDTYHVIEVPKKKVLGKKKKKKRASLTWHSLWRASAFVSHPLASSPESWPHPAALRAALPHLFTASEGPWQASASAAPGRGE